MISAEILQGLRQINCLFSAREFISFFFTLNPVYLFIVGIEVIVALDHTE
jgi:hypothetical protein